MALEPLRDRPVSTTSLVASTEDVPPANGALVLTILQKGRWGPSCLPHETEREGAWPKVTPSGRTQNPGLLSPRPLRN